MKYEIILSRNFIGICREEMTGKPTHPFGARNFLALAGFVSEAAIPTSADWTRTILAARAAGRFVSWRCSNPAKRDFR